MKKACFLSIFGIFFLLRCPCFLLAQETEPPEWANDTDALEDYYELEEDYEGISDPLEPINRIFFNFNDKLYFWFLKPVASGYRSVVPEPVRTGLDNFFYNLKFPLRFVNCVLQAKFEGAACELGRFMVNSTVGAAGFFDVAGEDPEMKEYDEDMGQTLGSYGLGNGFYIHWPFLGPSSARDTLGGAGDYFLDPVFYIDIKTKYSLAVTAFEEVNNRSFTIGEYEDLKKVTFDPYIALRDAYFQHRQSKIED
jgi:phospholipid-binding lipoprotein MlaA